MEHVNKVLARLEMNLRRQQEAIETTQAQIEMIRRADALDRAAASSVQMTIDDQVAATSRKGSKPA